MPEDPPPFVSPEATGGAGEAYEREVGTACLATLLTGGVALFTSDTCLSKVSFQTRNNGWRTDDLLLEGTTDSHQTRRIAIQVKLEFALQRGNADAVAVVSGAWKDFINPSLFNPEMDRIGLIVGKTTQIFGRGIRALTEAARASESYVDFRSRLAPGAITQNARDVLVTMLSILESVGTRPSEDQLWKFLCVFQIAVLDFGTATGSTLTFVKSLLSATSLGPSGSGLETWNELFVLATDASRFRRSIAWNNIPNKLRDRHRTSSSPDRVALANLNAASNVVRASVIDSIAGRVKLPRREIVSEVFESLQTKDAVIITGTPGGGKSVVAAQIYDQYRNSSLAMSVRSETLATPHLATSLNSLGMNFRSALSLFAVHDQIFVWIESAERLLEKNASEREAFGDFLRAVRETGKAKLLITCRQYSLETFRSAFLERTGIKTATIVVPPLSEDEVNEVSQEIPSLITPLTSPIIRKLLRNPFYLDLAARMSWSDDDTVPIQEKAFRQKAWREIVCKVNEIGDGYPLQRDSAMVDICLRRARKLSAFVPIGTAPNGAVQRLLTDGLLSQSQSDLTMVSPSHDVYEDWALLQWTDRILTEQEGLNPHFFDTIGVWPALRRAYRRWLGEWLESEPDRACKAVIEVIRNGSIQSHWKDDTFIALLQSSQVDRILHAIRDELYAEKGFFLERAVHLLRLACKQSPDGADSSKHLILLPGGEAWEVMTDIVADALPDLTMASVFWILNFVEESSYIRREDPLAPANLAIAKIAKCLLGAEERIKYAARRDYTDRVVKVMLAVPLALETDIRNITAVGLNKDDSQSAERVKELILNHFSGVEVAHRLPDLAEAVASEWMELETIGNKSHHHMFAHDGVEHVFGFSSRLSLDEFPPSAWQGPLLNLLIYHPERGLSLILRLFNRSAAAYGEADQDIIEPVEKLVLKMNDGTEIEQYANPRLWNIYRASSVAPHILESAAMGLETWLLEKTARGDSDTAEVFTSILQQSNNVIVTAILASVALSSYQQFGSAAVPLLTSPYCFSMDFDRCFQDQQSWNHGGLTSSIEQAVFDNERKEAAKKPHRRFHLEHLTVMLQLTEARDTVFRLLDDYTAKLPSESERTDGDHLWALILHRVDTRKFVPEEHPEGTAYVPGPPSDSIREYQQKDAPTREDHTRRSRLLLWGIKLWENRAGDNLNVASAWREKLTEVRALDNVPSEAISLISDAGAQQIAGVCVRDHLTELTQEERAWCSEILVSVIERLPDNRAYGALMDHSMGGATQGAYLLPLLAVIVEDEVLRQRIYKGLVFLLSNGAKEISHVVGQGIGSFLFQRDRELALSCVEIMISSALRRNAFFESQRGRYGEDRNDEVAFRTQLDGAMLELLNSRAPLNEVRMLSANYRTFPFLGLLMPILAVFSEGVTDPVGNAFYTHIANELVHAWRNDHVQNFGKDEEKDDLKFVERGHAHRLVARAILISPEEIALPIVDIFVAASADCPKEAADFLEVLVTVEGTIHSVERFWIVWERFIESYLNHHNATKPTKGSINLLQTILMGDTYWNQSTTDWVTLRGNGVRITRFFDRVTNVTIGLSTFVQLACRFQNEFLPGAFVLIARKLKAAGDISLTVSASSSLENTLAPLVYSGASSVRTSQEIRQAVLDIIDYLIETGSSVAFRLRDDFLLPVSE